ncbi:MAG: bifunctional methylenetetrahydrofolate dehydrogenase/methenyltetrahydrofolate cyclohydrolase FolD [Deltaproteobacteria bacterium CG11_big_fil_rev_8_21_14_0_20_47_16]|nr:MAG: bifunctional methylenetetrahydrofolate dehydrogenase/methenyltetrahydrofolate cyclohydrolase FolD [Deltaproteobacteria bacterium CG11_big_fil_rev_8_21_14_0_20_47_16]
MQLIDGKKIAQERQDAVTKAVQKLATPPHLVVVLVGEDSASVVYTRNKHATCEKVGMKSTLLKLPATISEDDLLSKIHDLNQERDVHGILIQLPLPKHISADRIMDAIDPHKDVDGFHPENVGLLHLGQPRFVPCTPKGVMTLLDSIDYDCAGKNAVVIGRSNIVGKPMAELLLQRNATVTICHSKTKDITTITRTADILVAAAGKPHLVTADWVKPGACVIDVGIHRMPDGKLTGDVDFDSVSKIAGWITPVPGGVGPMTIATLLENTLQAAEGAI